MPSNSYEKDIKRIILESDPEYYTMHVFGKLYVKDTIQQFLTTSI